MGYHVSIVRTRQGEKDAITGNEVKLLAEAIKNTKIEPPSLKSSELELLILNDDKRPLLRLILQHGVLWAKNPDEDGIQSMINLAEKLNGRVRGDNFETFRTPKETYVHPDDLLEIQKADEYHRKIKEITRRKQWTLNLIIISIFLILIILVAHYSKS
jgi:hypothetical protein